MSVRLFKKVTFAKWNPSLEPVHFMPIYVPKTRSSQVKRLKIQKKKIDIVLALIIFNIYNMYKYCRAYI